MRELLAIGGAGAAVYALRRRNPGITLRGEIDPWYGKALRAFRVRAGYPDAQGFQPIAMKQRDRALAAYGRAPAPWDKWPAGPPDHGLAELCDLWGDAVSLADVFVDEAQGGGEYRNDRNNLTAQISEVKRWARVLREGSTYGEIVPVVNIVGAWKAIAELSMGIDDEGRLDWGADYYQIRTLGESVDKAIDELPDTLGDAGKWVGGKALGLLGDAAGGLVNAAAGVVFSPLGAVAVLGVLVWRARS